MRLAETVTFGGSGLDRAAELRGDSAALAAALAGPGARVLVLWRGKLLCDAASEQGLPLLLSPDHPVLAARPPVLLGRQEDGPVFAADVADWPGAEVPQGGFSDSSEQIHPAIGPSGAFRELRRIMSWLPQRQAELAATAKAVLGWHETHGFCARCGAASEVAMAGWQRNCPACGTSHFPRTDPVVIMLVTRHDRVLLGRSPAWPAGMYSLLAGFVEPGETVEAAVRREVFEEAGIRIGAVRYLSSQPWPFPASLMLGCHGDALSDSIAIDPDEIEDARWISRQDMSDVMAGEHAEIAAPRLGSIAHFLMLNWLTDTLE